MTAVKNGFRVVRCRGAVLSDGAAFEVGAQRSKGGRVSVHSRCRPGVRALLSLQYDMLTLFRAGRAPTLRRLAVERGRTSSALPCARHRASAAALHLATRRRFLVILNTVRCAACVAPVHFELGMPMVRWCNSLWIPRARKRRQPRVSGLCPVTRYACGLFATLCLCAALLLPCAMTTLLL